MKKLLRQFRFGERGFTLIELLVVVAILGVLAAVVVPNVGKFMGTGTDQAGRTELHNIQTAMMAMMADTQTATVAAILPVNATPDMRTFPDAVTPLYGNEGFRYLMSPKTAYWYSCAADGTVQGWWDSPGTKQIGIDDPP
ncbi:unnamed protein product [marine sediment metagenome]|uniref:Type II secretion system protein GspG C-terminal domain-containing protein n=1 Tax=marine sediment metagenome TaxID=412755 RepID=X1K5Y1_9ZZZZ